MKEILFQFGLDPGAMSVTPFGSGLINSTWKVTDGSGKPLYILQKVNTAIFKSPEDIAYNIRLIGNYLQDRHPGYLFVPQLSTITGADLVKSDDGYYRLFPFVAASHTIDVVAKPQQAYEAARQFGQFTKLLAGPDAPDLKTTLPDFHNLSLRYRQFEDALQNGDLDRIGQSKALIEIIRQNKRIVREYEIYKGQFTARVTHHDTKISNVLFDDADKGLCVIDLDTVMPGFFISDLGDMIRTYVCPVSEEEKDFSKISIRSEFYDAITEGYLSEMRTELSDAEYQHAAFAGEFMIYMQAVRFLTDHLNNDVYYGARYEGHNFVRAGNQLVLLNRLQDFLQHKSA